MHKTKGALIICLLLTLYLRAQENLPRLSATARGPGKILISWHNKYPNVSQISIQRSTDSLRNFTTLITVPDPRLPENGAMDNKAIHPNFYYRLFIILDNGKYFFSPSVRPHAQSEGGAVAQKEDDADTAIARSANTRLLVVSTSPEKLKLRNPSSIHGNPELTLANTVFVRKGDTLLGRLSGAQVQAFRDSLLRKTKDTLIFIDGDTVLIKPFFAKEVYRSSIYVFTGKYGNVHVALPDAPKRHYAVKFFDDADKLLFQLSEIRDPNLTLDKTNFRHSGWFHFELYDGEQLKEKNKFFIPKEF